jgi:predicted RNA binding protein YcfA (HicA-like mRNA interferase family)
MKILATNLLLRIILRMSRKEKLIAKLLNPASDGNWTLADTVRILSMYGFAEVGGKGSHRVFVSPDFESPIVLAAHGNQIKSGYIRAIREIIT